MLFSSTAVRSSVLLSGTAQLPVLCQGRYEAGSQFRHDNQPFNLYMHFGKKHIINVSLHPLSKINQIDRNGDPGKRFPVLNLCDLRLRQFAGVHQPGENNIVPLGNITDFFHFIGKY